jgi:hypothetical protein
VELPNEQGSGAWRISGNAIQPRFFTAEIAEIAESDAIGPSFVQAGKKASRL